MTQTPSPTDHTEEDKGNSSPESLLVVSLNPIPSPSLPFITVIPIISLLEDPHKSSDETSECDLFLKSLCWYKLDTPKNCFGPLKDQDLAREIC